MAQLASTNIYGSLAVSADSLISGKLGVGKVASTYPLEVNGDISATNFRGALIGNADTSTKLATARTINGVSFDGSANITIADSTKLPLSGGSLTGELSITSASTGNYNEGARINKASNNWAILVLGGVANSTSGAGAGAWLIGSNSSGNLVISENSSSESVGLILDTDVGVKWKGNIVWHAGNDGSGSTLDADLLDNRHATNFAYSEDKTTVDLNTITQSGMFRLSSGNANAPAGVDYGQLLVMHGSGDTITQIMTDYNSNYIYWRSGNPTDVGGTGSWKVWRKIWHDGNDGAGSTLDADLLDGQEGSYYLNWTNATNKPSFTTGQVLYGAGTTTPASSSNLFWDNTNARLGIGINAPTHSLDVSSSSNAVGTWSMQRWGLLAQESSYNLSLKQLVTAGLVKHIFSTTNAGTLYDNNLVLDRGNVGIGTAAPSSILSTEFTDTDTTFGASYGQYGLFIRNKSGAVNTIAGIGFNTDTSSSAAGEIGFQRVNAASNYNDFFVTTKGASGFSEKMRITGTGFVGVGTSTPSYSVETTGDMRVQSSQAVRFGGTGAADTKFKIQYNATEDSLDFIIGN